ncbi:MAG: hypothetical protein AAF541_23450 [Pseudomonadota bacterium]
MSEKIEIKLVISQEDYDFEQKAAETISDYKLKEATKIEMQPSGMPIEKELADSLLDPAEGMVESRFVDPVTAVAVVTLSTLAIRLTNHWMKEGEYGVQIDQRTCPATVSRLAGVPFGTISVIDSEGNTTLHREEYAQVEDVIGKLKSWFRNEE